MHGMKAVFFFAWFITLVGMNTGKLIVVLSCKIENWCLDIRTKVKPFMRNYILSIVAPRRTVCKQRLTFTRWYSQVIYMLHNWHWKCEQNLPNCKLYLNKKNSRCSVYCCNVVWCKLNDCLCCFRIKNRSPIFIFTVLLFLFKCVCVMLL